MHTYIDTYVLICNKMHNFRMFLIRLNDVFFYIIDAGESDVPKRKKRKIYNGNFDQGFSHDKDEKCNSDNDDDDDNDEDEDDDDDNNNDDDDNYDDDDDDDPVTYFRRGQDLPSDLDLGDNSQDSIGDLEGDNEDDREWNALGAALEREFLSE